MHKSFSEYFTDREIIFLLCKYRLKHARKRHKIHMMRDISSHPKTNLIIDEKYACPPELSELLPSRRTWSRLSQSKRKRQALDGRFHPKDSSVVSLESLFNTVMVRRKNRTGSDKEEWIDRLERFIQDIQDVLSGYAPIHLNAPRITPVDKGGKKRTKQYRPIASYELKDRVIISLCSNYLMSMFDDKFHDCSHAFRKKKDTNHHSAVRAIKEYKREHPDEDLWVTECDIQKFYDSVNHREIKKTFTEFSYSCYKFGKAVHERASDVFFAYLSSYSFNTNVLPLSGDEIHYAEFGLPTGVYKWIDPIELYPDGIDNERIGVPQGGALSCLIANLLLHKVDTLVFPRKLDPELLYIRYCDDMVIIHPNKRKCLSALNRYKKALTNLKLAYHIDQDNPKYGKAFWNEELKSKRPYRWSLSHVPWLNFVGYQVKADLAVRVRRKSIVKEIKKQRSETNRVLRAIDAIKSKSPTKSDVNEHSRKSINQLAHSLRVRLISMSVGRVSLHNYKDHTYTLCWSSGFQELNFNKHSRSQMTLLDRMRGKQLCRLKKKLSGLKIDSTDSDKDNKVLKYYGTPFSYYRYILKKNLELNNS